MRTLIDIPEKQINELAIICKAKNLPRTEVIRQAIVAYIASNTPSASQAFGLWSKNAVDGLDYQEKVRSEW
ncbi:CopG family transcriptional regulator [Methylotenera sp.]|uniref:CopG family transcriptional regulator n=1 Tax=Methylotenera sp. TaxID=2051956 RepID=UPI00273148F7|nr:CopG family transcriptional regulator [Methylotenera sp.]MDP2071797.1 CopG family transcriptional regulator [Methylotenera sp.]MDP3005600.1 CopG family transcriptional regulator [Methylotenera sp.]